MIKDLKPCPFCGGKAKVKTQYSEKKDRWFSFVQCLDCFARSKTATAWRDPTDNLSLMDRATANWNMRAEK